MRLCPIFQRMLQCSIYGRATNASILQVDVQSIHHRRASQVGRINFVIVFLSKTLDITHSYMFKYVLITRLEYLINLFCIIIVYNYVYHLRLYFMKEIQKYQNYETSVSALSR